MTRKTVGILGLITTTLYFISFILLFIYNPQTWIEVDNVPSLASFNLVGMNGRWIAAYLIYLSVGLLSSAFVLGLFAISKNDLPIIIGKILALVAGLIWTSFGIVKFDSFADNDMDAVMFRVISILVIAPFGLVFLGSDFDKIIRDNFSKYYTLGSGLIILLLGALSVIVFNDQTWIRTNASLTIYFLWFGVIGLRFLQKSQRPT